MNLRLKRLELCLGHMLSVPPDRVVLDSYGIYSLKGLGHDQACGAAGCVLGHIQTIPEYRKWEEDKCGDHTYDHYEAKHRVLNWLGYPGELYRSSPNCGGCNLFGPGASGEKGKQQAIKRLEYLIDQAHNAY